MYAGRRSAGWLAGCSVPRSPDRRRAAATGAAGPAGAAGRPTLDDTVPLSRSPPQTDAASPVALRRSSWHFETASRARTHADQSVVLVSLFRVCYRGAKQQPRQPASSSPPRAWCLLIYVVLARCTLDWLLIRQCHAPYSCPCLCCAYRPVTITCAKPQTFPLLTHPVHIL